jgi:RimJ/RimL family protein N-acetyltransferase
MIKGKLIRLRPKTIEDADNDYRWQTDPELSDLDAITPLHMSFSDYIIEYRDMLKHPSVYRRPLAVETAEGSHIGNCVWYNIDKVGLEAEVGIMIGDRTYWNRGYGTDSMQTLVDYIFKHTNFKRVYLKTLEKNLRAQKSFQKVGFTPTGYLERDGYKFLLMELPRPRWQELKTKVKATDS